MARNKRKGAQPWWRSRRLLRRVTISTAIVAVIALFVWIGVLVGGRGEEGEAIGEPLTEAAPAFALSTVGGGTFSSGDHLGEHALLLFINEGMGCGPCFDQIVDLEADWQQFEALDVQLVSIMVDPMDALEAEIQARDITSVVAADEDKETSNAYGAMEASMHPGVKPGHTFILVDKAGQMVWRWDWPGHGAMYVDVDEIYAGVEARLSETS